nr:MAG TPA: hypothetical protein [Bacteriophage sp.]
MPNFIFFTSFFISLPSRGYILTLNISAIITAISIYSYKNNWMF